MHGDIVAVGPARVLGGLCGGGEVGVGGGTAGEETEGGGLAEEVAGAGGEDEGGEDVGGGGGEGWVGEGGHLGLVVVVGGWIRCGDGLCRLDWSRTRCGS